MKRSILFHYSVFNVGGAEKSLLRLMTLLCDRDWTVTLVLNRPGGSLESALDPRIEVLYLRSFSAGDRFKKAKGVLRRMAALPDAAAYLIGELEAKWRRKGFLRRRYTVAAVSLHGLDASFVCEEVSAGVRVHWIRNDLRQCDPERKAYDNIRRHCSCIDRYLCVSRTARDSFVELFPDLTERADLLYNVLLPDEMQRLSEVGTAPEMSCVKGLKVVTVCRLSDKAKGLLRMVRVHKRLYDEGIEFTWFVIGDGPDRELMQRAVDEAGLEGKMILLGSRENPFPYYKAADISATLSYYEGLCGAVNEAKVMGRPVIATEFSGIREQIVHGETGWIVANDEEAIVTGMRRLLTDADLRKHLANDLLPREILDDNYKIMKFQSLCSEEHS